VAQEAARRWESVIIGDLPTIDIDVQGYPPELKCGPLPVIVDDIYICFKDPVIDGVGGVLGQAGPVLVRSDSNLTASGYMEFDAADVQLMLIEGTLKDVIIHEMGHVLGLGTLWEDKGLVSNQGSEIFPNFVYKPGTKACSFWQDITGCSGCPPIENEFGPGTAGGHWDEDVMGNELMSGFSEDAGTFMPLSNITVGSLEDLGYEVDYSAADPFLSAPSCGFRLRKTKQGKPQKDPKKLSEVGRARAFEYGKLVLTKAKARKPKNLPDELTYVADRHVDVIYLEAGKVHIVGVSDIESP